MWRWAGVAGADSRTQWRCRYRRPCRCRSHRQCRCSKPGRAEFPARAEDTVRTRQGIHWNVTRREQPPDLEDWHREIRNTRETMIWQRITETPARYRQCRRATPATILIARQVLGNADKHNERVHPIDEHRMSTQIHEPWHLSQILPIPPHVSPFLSPAPARSPSCHTSPLSQPVVRRRRWPRAPRDFRRKPREARYQYLISCWPRSHLSEFIDHSLDWCAE